MNYLKTKKFIQSVIKSHTTRRLCFFNRKRKPNSRSVPAFIHCETIVIHLVKVNNKRFQRQFNVLRSLYHAQNSLPLATNLFYTSVLFYLPIQRTATCKFRFTSFPLIECNSLPYAFLLKTHILLSFSNHELYFISSFCRSVNINHPKLCHLQKYLPNVCVNQISKQTSIPGINSIVNIYQFTQA